MCLPSSSYTSSGPFAASAQSDTDNFTTYRAVAQLRRHPPITGNTTSSYSGSFRYSSGSEHHLHYADLSWTALSAAAGGPWDIHAYFASSGSGSKLCPIDSANYFRTAPSASMAGGIRFLD